MSESKNNNTLTGILVDVSGSMRTVMHKNDDIKIQNNNITRGQTVFNTIFDILKHDINNNNNDNNDVFALAFGLKKTNNGHCDLLKLFGYLLGSLNKREYCQTALNEYKIKNSNKYIKSETNDDNMCYIVGHKPLINMATQNGAPYCHEYIREYLTVNEAGFLFIQFYKRMNLLHQMIHELPESCKNEGEHKAVAMVNNGGKFGVAVATAALLFGGPFGMPVAIGAIAVGAGVSAGTSMSKDKAARVSVKRAKELLLSPIYDNIIHENYRDIVMKKQDVIVLMNKVNKHYTIKNNNNNDSNNDSFDIKKLMNDIEEYIYGYTPMKQSFIYTRNIFRLKENVNAKHKILLVISDGISTDGNVSDIAKELRDNGVKIVTCFITNKHINKPKKLYDEMNDNWDSGAKTMFEIASMESNKKAGLSLLEKEGWELGLSGQSKLFIQANNPDIIDQFCKIVNKLANDNDEIMKYIGHFNLNYEIYNKYNNQKARNQFGGTCYANAISLVMHLAMMRIHNRDGGNPGFIDLRKEITDDIGAQQKYRIKYYCNRKGFDYDRLIGIIDNYGKISQDNSEHELTQYCNEYKTNKEFVNTIKGFIYGANTEIVLQKYCQKYRLHSKRVTNDNDVRKAINNKRPLVCRFSLNGKAWYKLDEFYKNNPKGILTKDDLKHDDNTPNNGCGGHAVIVIDIKPDCLVLMNSFGNNWGDNGLFRIKNGNVLNATFYDVYWTLDDLTDNERNAYKKYCQIKTSNLVNQYINPKLYNINHICPICNKTSKISEYSGNISEALCPKCNKTFKPTFKQLIDSLSQKTSLNNINDNDDQKYD